MSPLRARGVDRLKPKDRIRIGPKLEDGRRLATRIHADGSTSNGIIAPAEDGKPIHGELLRVNDECHEGWHDVDTVYDASPTLNGPAQVATPRYREGYDRIFGTKQPVGEA